MRYADIAATGGLHYQETAMKNADMPAMPGRVITNGESFVETLRPGAQAVSAESGKAQPEGQDFPPLPEVWMVDWVASKTGDHYQEFHDSEAGAFLTAAQLAAATPAMPARITQLNPDPMRAALVEALKLMLEGTQEDCGRIRCPRDSAVIAAFAALRAAGVVLS